MSQVSLVEGDRTLPSGFAHPHASEEARTIAEAGLILRAQVGSGVHGTAVSGQDDRDEMPASQSSAVGTARGGRPRQLLRSHLAYWEEDWRS